MTIQREAVAERPAGALQDAASPSSTSSSATASRWGSSLLIAGVAGTGKTVLSLEFIYRGALAGEKGILFSFEETEERLRAAARGARLGSRPRDRPRA